MIIRITIIMTMMILVMIIMAMKKYGWKFVNHQTSVVVTMKKFTYDGNAKAKETNENDDKC